MQNKDLWNFSQVIRIYLRNNQTNLLVIEILKE